MSLDWSKGMIEEWSDDWLVTQCCIEIEYKEKNEEVENRVESIMIWIDDLKMNMDWFESIWCRVCKWSV